MKAFVDKYEDRIHGVLSCFDRMLFRGYLPIMSGWSMVQLLQANEIDCASVKPFLLSSAERVKPHAQAMAREQAWPFEYLSAKTRKEEAARKIAERDGVDEGLVCVFSALEPCRTFSLRSTTGQPYMQTAKRKCLHLLMCCSPANTGSILAHRSSLSTFSRVQFRAATSLRARPTPSASRDGVNDPTIERMRSGG